MFSWICELVQHTRTLLIMLTEKEKYMFSIVKKYYDNSVLYGYVLNNSHHQDYSLYDGVDNNYNTIVTPKKKPNNIGSQKERSKPTHRYNLRSRKVIA